MWAKVENKPFQVTIFQKGSNLQDFFKTRSTNLFLLVIIAILFVALLFGPRLFRTEETFYYVEPAMGTIIRLTIVTDGRDSARQAADKVFALIHKLEQDFDHRKNQGSVVRINALAGVKPVRVTTEAFRLIEKALGFCEKTDGVFDITIGAFTVTPDYYYNLPTREQQGLVDYRLVQMNREERTVFLPKKGMALDLGGIAKGTIVDFAVDLLKKEGVTAGIVEAGGDFYCFGDRIWRIGIQHPRQEGLLGVIKISNRGVCGSGDYRQYIIDEKNGKPERKHHIIDPQSMGSARKSISLTVLASTAELADALATTLFIMGPVDGRKFLTNEYPDIPALWILPNLELIKTDNFPSFIES